MKMPSEQRYVLRSFATDSNEPGLIRESDGTVWVVAPGGTRTQVSGSGDFNSLVLVPTDPTVEAAEFDYSQNDEWVGAILVRVKDVATLAGTSWVLRSVDEASAASTFELDAKGGASIREAPGGGSDSASWVWRAADGDEVLSVLSGQKKVSTEGSLMVGAIGAETLKADATGVAFYGATPAAQPSAPVTLQDVIDALQALGLVAT